MSDKTDNFQAQFSGFFNTPHLFFSEINTMQPFVKQLDRSFVFNKVVRPNIRLGQRVEQFVFEELKHFDDISVLSENIQIQENVNQTIGELDCLLLDKAQPIHLEIQFKYYLYDANLGNTEIECLIGPMRRDSLIEKLNKLKLKQLPLLHNNATTPYLDKLQLKANTIKQQIYFKAQIFVPYGSDITFKTINNACVYGFYFNYKDLGLFKDCKFYKPQKTDWLLDLNSHVNWLTLEQIQPQLTVYQSENYSPLLWLKFPNGQMTKCFVVAW
ncbi:DUF1853 family protein [Olleya marilimosa]|uniref:DUF1853 family protein n=1 Tax=Olleya marilimosa TaxID=272164 RepID=UPI0030EBEA0B|tara:strand:- start:25314 stop:26126 length:813 start_codon:yes stop_codon:yes gene_type:complete